MFKTLKGENMKTMKYRLIIFLVIVLVLLINSCGRISAPSVDSLKMIANFEYITFAGREWIVLERNAGRALVISKDILFQRQYHTSNVSITWENSSIRAYLNGEFYNSFSAADRNRIVEVTNTNENNQYYGTNGGSSTQDRIFLLSFKEVVKYFGDSGKRGYWINDQYNSIRIATYNGSASCWWLRSPGYYTNYACYVSDDGYIGLSGNNVNNTSGGVRPALWLNL